MAVNFYDIFAPYVILYPFSPTTVSTSSKKIHGWFLYRLYTFVCYIAVAGALVRQLYMQIFVNNKHLTLSNKPFTLILCFVFFTILLAQSVMGAKKNKMVKLMDEINKIDDVDYSINDRKYKIYNAAFAFLVLGGHVACTVVNILYSRSDTLVIISTMFINIMSNVEILILSSFVIILNAKMAHIVLKLENIVKNKEASKEKLYEHYRQGLYIVKRINNFWEGRMFMIIIFELYFTIRTVLKLFARKQSLVDVISVFNVIFKYGMSVRHLLIYIQLGATGQWLGECFDQMSQLANTISDMDLGDELNHQMMKICRLAAVCPGRLRAGSLQIDGHLPLRAVSAVISTVILMLQFGITEF